MRVTAVLPRYPTLDSSPHPRTRVGAWLSTHELLVGLVRAGHDVSVRTTAASSGQYEIDGVRVGAPDATPDVVVAHLDDRGRARIYAERHSARLVRIAHGTPRRWPGAHLIVFNSVALRARAISDGWRGDSIVVHPIVWPTNERSHGDAVTLASLSLDKGASVFHALSCRITDARFIGLLPSKKAERYVASYGRNVSVRGRVANMRPIYLETRINLMPSAHESFGRVAVEAATYGIPTIAHPTSGLLEALGGAGVFVDRDDVRGWEEVVRRLLDPMEWEAASAHAIDLASGLRPRDQIQTFVLAVEELF